MDIAPENFDDLDQSDKKTRRFSEGLFSLLWFGPGFVAYEIFEIEWWTHFGSSVLVGGAVLLLWFVGGMVTALSGVRRDSRTGKIAGLGTLLWGAYVVWDIIVPRIS